MRKSILKLGQYGVLGVAVSLVEPAFAVQVTDHLDIGGAVRFRYDFDPDRDVNQFGLDTIFATAKYTSDTWIGAAKYRFYGKSRPYQYTKKIGDISFPEYAWVGYKFDENRQVQVGLNQVPFGLQTYFGSTFMETLGYPLGLEDLYELGTKYIQKFDGGWNVQAGYYLRPAWQGKGTSRGGVTYSNVPSAADGYVPEGSNNQERNMVALRVAKSLDLGGWASEVGVSALTSTLQNTDTGDDGRRNAVAVHFSGTKDAVSVSLLAARQQMSPRNAINDDVVTMGGYDSTYKIASRGTLYVADVGYSIGGTYLDGLINNARVYSNYSAFVKSGTGYENTQRLILGNAFFVGNHLMIATEWAFGKNDLYIGGSSFTDSLAAGGTDHWENQLNINFGYYF